MFFTALFFLGMESLADLLQPTLMSYIVDHGVEQKDVRQILIYGIIMLLVAACGAAGAVTRNIFATRTSQTISRELRSDIYRKVLSLSTENIRKAMLEITHGRTSIIIAHRLSTIRDSDLILLMENGRIAEQGSHEELMSLNGTYANMYRTQIGQA